MAEDWSDDELRAAVKAYRVMQAKTRLGEKLVKKQIYRELADEFGRTEKAFEYRMQNISAVLSMLGREWLTGLRPAENVGTNVASKLERLINEFDGLEANPTVGFEIAVRDCLRREASAVPEGQGTPTRVTTEVTSFVRSPAVKAWVLKRAGGRCECCNAPAPFLLPDGTPFLEVHHLRKLADNGSDRISNAVALCPNCHRHMHYGPDAERLRADMINRIPELRHE